MVCVSDHVNAWLDDGKLWIENPTQMASRVKVMAEKPEDMKQKLGLYWLDRFRIVEVNAKERVCVDIEQVYQEERL